ncbi:uncharacterized protein LOC127844237 [Dreissena polymorpha]|uniref:Rhodanese domain-containing protein n=1 Tax=Dreissena polymorpha TaxID=45954 RepID=A0A9D4EA99_DREPO|nr:uncharacterized protein LOC127844237 [Dreissena polymorpha]KAH3774690.1 hypothetical protein DPMN_176077 [Dreissena polymorpha]
MQLFSYGRGKRGIGETGSLWYWLAIAGIAVQFPSVKCISTEKFAEMFGGPSKQSDVIILDTRPEEEYKVSHIPGAIHVDFEGDAFQIIESVPQLKTPDQVDTVVCYCFIGYRSSVVAEKLVKVFSKTDTSGPVRPTVVNLEGSLFKWANERRPLVDAENQPTIYAHPYNAVFGKLLDKDLRRYGKL